MTTTEVTENAQDAKQEEFLMEKVSPLRKPTVLRISQMGSTEDTFYVKEWTAKNLFAMINTVKSIIGRLKAQGVISFAPGSTDDMTDDEIETRNASFAENAVNVIAESEEDLYTLLGGSVFIDNGCKQAAPKEVLEDLTLADIIILVRGIWVANWEKGSLKKVVNASFAGLKTAKPKQH